MHSGVQLVTCTYTNKGGINIASGLGFSIILFSSFSRRSRAGLGNAANFSKFGRFGHDRIKNLVNFGIQIQKF
jgi:hypothetical protein